MERKPYEVYIRVDDKGYVIDINSSAFIDDASEWIKIAEGHGDQYHHAQGHYLPDSLCVDSGVYRYMYVDGAVRECTEAEITQQEALLPAPAPSDRERIAELEAALELLLSGGTE